MIKNTSKQETNIPEEFLCPISWEIMTDPVILSDEHTYDRTSVKYFKNGFSPITKLPIKVKTKLENRLIKNLIDKFIWENKIKVVKPKKLKSNKIEQTNKIKNKNKNNKKNKLDSKSITIKKKSVISHALKIKPEWLL